MHSLTDVLFGLTKLSIDLYVFCRLSTFDIQVQNGIHLQVYYKKGHLRLLTGILFGFTHLPVSILNLCEDSFNLVYAVLNIFLL